MIVLYVIHCEYVLNDSDISFFIVNIIVLKKP